MKTIAIYWLYKGIWKKPFACSGLNETYDNDDNNDDDDDDDNLLKLLLMNWWVN